MIRANIVGGNKENYTHSDLEQRMRRIFISITNLHMLHFCRNHQYIFSNIKRRIEQKLLN